MRIAQSYLDQLAAEVGNLNRQARAVERQGNAEEAERLRLEATAKERKLTRLRSERTDGVRFG